MAGRGLPAGGWGCAGGRVGSSWCGVGPPPAGLLNTGSELSVDLTHQQYNSTENSPNMV